MRGGSKGEGSLWGTATPKGEKEKEHKTDKTKQNNELISKNEKRIIKERAEKKTD